jgi:hypothetical protein
MGNTKMTELSVLAHEYKMAAELSHKLNLALIILKKAVQSTGIESAEDQEQINSTRMYLAEILEGIYELIDPDDLEPTDSPRVNEIPSDVVTRLREKRSGSYKEILGSIESAIKRLEDQNAKIRKYDLRLLDQVTSAADEQTSRVYHQMMRK